MNYALNIDEKDEEGKIGKESKSGKEGKNKNLWSSVKEILALMSGEKKVAIVTLFIILFNSALNLAAPLLIAYAVDHYVTTANMQGILLSASALLLMYAASFFAQYFQMIRTGGIGQRVVWNLRNTIFKKLQELPIQFFNQNKTGDLISRINNDTELLNQFFSQYITRFVDSIFMLLGITITVLIVNPKFGTALLLPAVCLLIITKLIGGWLKSRNKKSLQSIGGMSSEIQESLNNFKVIVAFNRRDYFKKKFEEVNQTTFKANMKASIANSTVAPLYDLAANAAQLLVLTYGIYLVGTGEITIGLVLAFFTYADKFYYPLRQFASIWTSFQLSLAGWDRISQVLKLKSNLIVLDKVEVAGGAKGAGANKIGITSNSNPDSILSFDDISFSYKTKESNEVGVANAVDDDSWVIRHATFDLLKGKTYALVGPTGGGKTTTASLMARLFDPTEGIIRLAGEDIRTVTQDERTQKIGFILQEPFLFSGTVRENILYGNVSTTTGGATEDGVIEVAANSASAEIEKQIKGFDSLLKSFENGIDTVVKGSGDGMSLGQKQLIAFMRAIIRQPDILILDEATANIDTITESLLEEVLRQLSPYTTKVIIAHRLNTIKDADEIFFVGGGKVTPAGSFEHAMDLLLHNKRES